MKTIISLVSALILVVNFIDAIKEEKTPAQIYFESVPIEKRTEFLRFHLTKGFIGGNHNYIVNGNEPQGFSESLVEWVKSEFQLNQLDLVKLIKYGSLCPDDSCVDINDVGIHCCPF